MKKDEEDKKQSSNGRWKCPICKVEAEVKDRAIHVFANTLIWPLHGDCEFVKDLDSIDFKKLEKVS